MKDLELKEEEIMVDIVLIILVNGIILLFKRRKFINRSRRDKINKIIKFNNDVVCNLNIILLWIYYINNRNIKNNFYGSYILKPN